MLTLLASAGGVATAAALVVVVAPASASSTGGVGGTLVRALATRAWTASTTPRGAVGDRGIAVGNVRGQLGVAASAGVADGLLLSSGDSLFVLGREGREVGACLQRKHVRGVVRASLVEGDQLLVHRRLHKRSVLGVPVRVAEALVAVLTNTVIGAAATETLAVTKVFFRLVEIASLTFGPERVGVLAGVTRPILRAHVIACPSPHHGVGHRLSGHVDDGDDGDDELIGGLDVARLQLLVQLKVDLANLSPVAELVARCH